MINPAIYTITNLIDGKVYVGSSQHGKRRIYVHRWKLRRGTHDNVMLQRAWTRDGEGAFRFDIVEACALEELLAREQAWIDRLQSTSDQRGYNLCPVAGTVAGVVMPESHRESARARFKGKPKSPEHRARISAAQRGRSISPEQREKNRAAAIAQFSDPTARQQASEAAKGRTSPFKGRKHSEESIQNMRAAAQARWDGVPRKKRVPRLYTPVPAEERRTTGPKKGTPRNDRRSLSADQVRAIRNRKAEGWTFSALVAEFGLDRNSLFNIVHRKTYVDIQ